MLDTVAGRDLPGSWLDGLKARTRTKAKAAPMFLSDRVAAWLAGLPELVVRKGLLLVDVADALGIPESRAKAMLAHHRWWRSAGVEFDNIRWLPPWAPLHPQEDLWEHDDGRIRASEPYDRPPRTDPPPGWVRKPTWRRLDGSWVWW